MTYAKLVFSTHFILDEYKVIEHNDEELPGKDSDVKTQHGK